jgi:hypothetical protein
MFYGWWQPPPRGHRCSTTSRSANQPTLRSRIPPPDRLVIRRQADPFPDRRDGEAPRASKLATVEGTILRRRPDRCDGDPGRTGDVLGTQGAQLEKVEVVVGRHPGPPALSLVVRVPAGDTHGRSGDVAHPHRLCAYAAHPSVLRAFAAMTLEIAARTQRVEQLGEARLVKGHRRGYLLCVTRLGHAEDHAGGPPTWWTPYCSPQFPPLPGTPTDGAG